MDLHSVQNVIIFGKCGVGKSSIANLILGRDEFKVGSNYNHQHSLLNDGQDVQVWIINPPQNLSNKPEDSSATTIEQYYKKYLPEWGSLVLFVYKHGRFTEETVREFEQILEVLNSDISQISVLVITHCEGTTSTSQDTIIQDFKTNEHTKKIASFMKTIICVGIPDLQEVEKELRSTYSAGIMNSKMILQNMLSETKGINEQLFSPQASCCTVL